MADTPALTPRDYDPWQLATPLQLLTLLERLDVSMSEVARWLHVPRSSISMWRHGTREVPPKHLPTLRQRTLETWRHAVELNDKAVSLAPTEDLRQALRAEFAALYTRWKAEVLSEAGTLRRAVQADYATLGRWLACEPFTVEAEESIAMLTETIVQKVRLMRSLEGEPQSPEEALIARLTAAHAAAPIMLTAEERAAAEADQPETL
jgi:hypothetical protein